MKQLTVHSVDGCVERKRTPLWDLSRGKGGSVTLRDVLSVDASVLDDLFKFYRKPKQ